MRIEPPPSLAWAIGNMPGGDRGRGAAAGAARRAARVPGVAADAVARFSATVITPNSGVLVRPQRTKPAAASAPTTSSLSSLGALGRAAGAERHRPAGNGREVLDRDRDAEERRVLASARRRSASPAAARASSSLRQMTAFSSRVEPVDLGEARVEQLDSRELAAPQRSGKLERRRERARIGHEREPTRMDAV